MSGKFFAMKKFISITLFKEEGDESIIDGSEKNITPETRLHGDIWPHWAFIERAHQEKTPIRPHQHFKAPSTPKTNKKTSHLNIKV